MTLVQADSKQLNLGSRCSLCIFFFLQFLDETFVTMTVYLNMESLRLGKMLAEDESVTSIDTGN